MPFGGGGRICIGNRFAMVELKAALAHIMRHFSALKLDDARPYKIDQSLTMHADPVLGLHVLMTLQ